MMCVIILMKILNENDMRSETGGSDSSMSTKALTPCGYFGSSKVEGLEMKNLQLSCLSLFLDSSFINLGVLCPACKPKARMIS